MVKPVKYRVLVAEQLSKADRTVVAAHVATIYNGPEASLAAYHRVTSNTWVNENWQYEILDRLGRVGVLKYRGAEVALLFKRQIQEVEPLPCDPVPEGIIKDPNDAWQRFDLLGASARQVSARVGKTNRDLEQELRLAEEEIKAKQAVIDTTETFNHRLTQSVELHKKEILKLREQVKGFETGANNGNPVIKTKPTTARASKRR
jgi:hypothetical protein